MADKLTKAQLSFMVRDAYDEIWIGCPRPDQRRVARNLAAKGLGVLKGTGLMCRFHLTDVGRETRAQIIINRAADLIGANDGD